MYKVFGKFFSDGFKINAFLRQMHGKCRTKTGSAVYGNTAPHQMNQIQRNVHSKTGSLGFTVSFHIKAGIFSA